MFINLGNGKMKKKYKKIWRWISFIVTLIILVASIVFAIIFKISWWWLFGSLIFFSVGWLIFLIVYMIKRYKKLEGVVEKIDPEGALDYVRQLVKTDRDNPDNLHIVWARTWRMGKDEGKLEPTPILVGLGYGTEKKQNRPFLVNLNNPKKEITMLSEEIDIPELIDEANRMAEHPKEMIHEEGGTTFKHGMPETYFKRSKPSSQADRDKLVEKEKEEKSEL